MKYFTKANRNGFYFKNLKFELKIIFAQNKFFHVTWWHSSQTHNVHIFFFFFIAYTSHWKISKVIRFCINVFALTLKITNLTTKKCKGCNSTNIPVLWPNVQ